MRRLSREEFVETTDDAWTFGPVWAQLRYASRRLGVTVLFGALDEDETRVLFDTIEATRRTLPPRHVALVDGRGLVAATPALYAATVAFLATHRQSFARSVERLAAVRPDGLTGLAAAGFIDVVPLPYPAKAFTGLDEALAYLGLEPQLEAELETLVAEAKRGDDVLRRMAAALETRLRYATIEDCAQALGMSVRSLQRRLLQEETRFTAELAAARVKAARRLLEETTRPVSEISGEVGFASAAAFATAFQRSVGVTPTEYRRRTKRD